MRLKKLFNTILLIYFCHGIQAYSQVLDSLMLQLKSNISLDSLVNDVRILSGEDSVMINNEKVLISNREDLETKQLAAEYIFKKLLSYGYEPYYQEYQTGKNILAVKPGVEDTTINVILCAHYDSVTDFCADDNASGVSAVLEAARNLKEVETRFNIIFAFWDEEEVGLKGSTYFVENTSLTAANVNTVINLDMIGWDANDDGILDVGTTNTLNSFEVGSVVKYISEKYFMNIISLLHLPDLLRSDHDAFRMRNYSAILISEGYSTGDFNEYYHSSDDRIEHFNLDYFLNISTLSMLATYYCANSKIPYLDKLSVTNPFAFENNDEFIINAVLENTEKTVYNVMAVIDSIDSHNLDTLDMFDDGEHYDGYSGDNLWVNKWIPQQTEGYYYANIITKDISNSIIFNHPERKYFTSFGPVTLDSFRASINNDNLLKIDMWFGNHGMGNIDHELRYAVRILDTNINYGSSIFGNIGEIDSGAAVKIEPSIEIDVGEYVFSQLDANVRVYDHEYYDNFGRILILEDSVRNYLVVTSVDEINTTTSVSFNLEQNYPNPFNPTTTIQYSIPSVRRSGTSPYNVELIIYDILGNEIMTLVNEHKQPGTYQIEFDASTLSSGVYFYELRINDFHDVKKMMILK